MKFELLPTSTTAYMPQTVGVNTELHHIACELMNSISTVLCINTTLQAMLAVSNYFGHDQNVTKLVSPHITFDNQTPGNHQV